MKAQNWLITVFAVALLLGGCSSSSSDADSSGESASTDNGQETISTEDTGNDNDDSYPATWEDKMAGKNYDDMVEEYRREMLDGRKTVAEYQGKDLDIALEDYPTIRIVSQDEWSEAQAACMQESGFEATAGPDGGLAFESVGEDQVDAKEQAYSVCLIQYPVDPMQYGDLPSDEIARLYDHYVNTSMPCIEALGHSVPEPPTKETWIDQYMNGNQIWSPYDPLNSLGPIANVEELQDEAYSQCPNYPEDFWPSVN